MAASKRAQRRRGPSKKSKNQANNRIITIGVSVLVVALLAYGMFQVLGNYNQAATSSQALAANSTGLEANSLDEDHAAAGEPVTATDRETRYLGPPSDPGMVVQAEAGKLEQPTLLWFHADWCHICQRVKPDVVDLGEQYHGKLNIVRLNVDHAESREAVRRYGVRATPTFVLFDETGNVRGHVPGWPGYQAFSDAFEQLLTGS